MHDSQDSTVTLSADAYFKRSGFRARVRACMLAPHLDELVVWMTARGHPPNSIYTALRNALRLAEFAEEEGVREPALLTDDLVGRLLTGVEGQPRLHKERRLSCRLTMEFLREQAIVPAAAMPPSESGPYLLSEYLRYLVNHRGVGTRHALRHRAHVSKFVQFVLGDDVESVGSLEAAGVFRFVTTYAQELSRAQRKLMCAALRSFLRFLRVRGHLPTDLSSAVPVIPSFKLDRLPPVISAADIEQILAAVDRSTPIGRRDYAMLLLLGTYGMRAGRSARCVLTTSTGARRQSGSVARKVERTSSSPCALLSVRPSSTTCDMAAPASVHGERYSSACGRQSGHSGATSATSSSPTPARRD